MEEALKDPEKVIKLDIAMLKLTSIDPRIVELVNLECLDLSFNRFSTLPDEMAELKKLRVLNLTGTRFLSKVPAIVAEIPNLEELDIRDHPEWKGTQFEDAKKLLPNVQVKTKD
jgi:Leucine-rich repeat (LRR) protein